MEPVTSLSTSNISRKSSSYPLSYQDRKRYASILPGRVRRRLPSNQLPVTNSSFPSDAQSVRVVKWFHRIMKTRFFLRWKVHFVVLSWYILGCVSIATTKILLRDWVVSPLILTAQQLMIGVFTLHSFVSLHLVGSPSPTGKAQAILTLLRKGTPATRYLLLTAICFALGFYFTNWSFFGSHASFVETIKAAEPITSASIAYLFGIEGLSVQEVLSLMTISTGVIISTVGNALINSSSENNSSGHGTLNTITNSFQSTGVVLISNLCFSFRGIFQKLFRACPEGNLALFDDVNLQLRVQQIGFLLFVAPVMILHGMTLLYKILVSARLNDSSIIQYICLSFVNGFAFTSYNLASTYILSQLPVVQHAALNSLRRLFAIVVTSIIFSVPITFLSIIGILLSLIGFSFYTHFKTKRLRQPRPLSSLLPLNSDD